ncbi:MULTISPECIES: HAD family hydrolase [Dyella]|uniref:HAD family hydrolase n=1 Tax=Dyella TaxID=231454 RepID=UPI000C81A353|nr:MULTISPECIES: HAD family phosphatase [Dyella]MDR3446229.1 HAD family phosphatase [Dyella sp.]PMQ02688.1 Alpha-D-glucose-1-phosphate phosphatase YihX [Dyella sp. AD56]ULU24323.1 HAD family phosphatase [Dyella terrae]
MNKQVDTVVFDLGNVLIGWDPRRLYRQLIDDEAQMEWFLRDVCSSEWNEQQDAGRPWAEATALLRTRFPEHAELIDAYHLRWEETLVGALDESVALLAELRARGVRLLALTNWSQETFPIARQRFPFLQWFEGIVVSGEEKLIKPDPRIYQRLLERYAVDPAKALYIDDSARNVAAAEALGMHGWWFRDADGLRQQLVELQLLDTPLSEVSHG